MIMNIKKSYVAEFIGTAVLVIMGCGTAMTVGTGTGSGYLITALAFGLAIVAMAYSIGNISGCHVNPAVSLGVYLTGGISAEDLRGYIIAQFAGGIAGSGILGLIFGLSGIEDSTGGGGYTFAFGSNGISALEDSYIAALIVEIVLTYIFITAILGVTSKKANHGSFAGIVIGLTLTLVHLMGIGLTGTSVNPARSFGPALVALLTGNPEPIACVWIFIAAPLIGAFLAAITYKKLES